MNYPTSSPVGVNIPTSRTVSENASCSLWPQCDVRRQGMCSDGVGDVTGVNDGDWAVCWITGPL